MTLVEVLVAFMISGLGVAGIVSGYVFANTSAEKFAFSMAANAQASQYLEQMRSAQWDVSIYPAIDQLTVSNFPTKVVILETAGSSAQTNYATNYVQISTVSTDPPLRRIRVDCVWGFRGPKLYTNTIESFRAPNQ